MAKETGVCCVPGGIMGAGDTVAHKTELPSSADSGMGQEARKCKLTANTLTILYYFVFSV